MPITLNFEAVAEDSPGARWQSHFEAAWPGYRAWFLRGGAAGRPGYLACRRALREHMPELVPTWERLVALAGGGDVEARFLSLWCPPPYIAGCAQGVWRDPAGHAPPLLVRNYDYAPALLEAHWLASRWTGPRVLALGDCLWGALDGLNEAGLAASLSFGGRRDTGEGFGIPLVLRYLLEVATTTREAIAVLSRVPVHMSYSVTLLDRGGDAATVFVAPDRPAECVGELAVTNLQHGVEWPEHARATRAVEREQALRAALAAAPSASAATAALLQPPLYQTEWARGYGTLYTAAYDPAAGSATLLWPDEAWPQTVAGFAEGRRARLFDARGPDPASAPTPAVTDPQAPLFR